MTGQPDSVDARQYLIGRGDGIVNRHPRARRFDRSLLTSRLCDQKDTWTRSSIRSDSTSMPVYIGPHRKSQLLCHVSVFTELTPTSWYWRRHGPSTVQGNGHCTRLCYIARDSGSLFQLANRTYRSIFDSLATLLAFEPIPSSELCRHNNMHPTQVLKVLGLFLAVISSPAMAQSDSGAVPRCLVQYDDSNGRIAGLKPRCGDANEDGKYCCFTPKKGIGRKKYLGFCTNVDLSGLEQTRYTCYKYPDA
ncbi:hypothetical protein BCV70DRAFT_54694 [Testicularia cyperi]|uniref:Uncharacterized protein n=1 Tax=Testicularia cyperi TaxID=1882483 RepID=A0A317XVR3_9BASI|nr:hypothetical protein BCV70DRAFT_54694 [Testicularia cyperi]